LDLILDLGVIPYLVDRPLGFPDRLRLLDRIFDSFHIFDFLTFLVPRISWLFFSTPTLFSSIYSNWPHWAAGCSKSILGLQLLFLVALSVFFWFFVFFVVCVVLITLTH
jgi:hypothetical protein